MSAGHLRCLGSLKLHAGDALVSTISLCAATSSRVCGLYFSTHGASSFPSTIMGTFPFADMLDRL